MSSIKVSNRTHVDASFLNLSCSPLLKQLYANRGVAHESELDNSTKTLLHAKQLKGIDDACLFFISKFIKH